VTVSPEKSSDQPWSVSVPSPRRTAPVHLVTPQQQPRRAPIDPAQPVRWHAVRTLERQERPVADAMHRAGLDHYLPIVTIFREHATGTTRSAEVLFERHVFLHGDEDAVQYAWKIRRVHDIQCIDDQQSFSRELDQVRRATGSGAMLMPTSYVERGRPARIEGGPCDGVEGMIDPFGPPNILLLQLSALRMATSLAVDFDRIVPLP